MKHEIFSLLACPHTGEPLELKNRLEPDGSPGHYLAGPGGRQYRIREGVPVFVEEIEVTGSNQRYQSLYERFSPFYNLAQKAFYLFRGGEAKARHTYLKELEVKPGGRVLEVSVGTGANLRYLPRNAQFFGLDLTWGQLRQCRLMQKRTGIEVELFQGEAERLPFKDEVFDVVFHMGGINFFNGKEQAIREMIRVAKPGTKIVIVDETEKLARRAALVSPFFRHRQEPIVPPVHLVPREMDEISVREIRNGELWVISFRKPRPN